MDLSERQKRLLQLIISEFVDTAEAVGSISLQNKYQFDFSPATIRNEMADLVYSGYLYQKHNSGGRIPTTKGWRFFVEDLLRNLQELDPTTQDKINEVLFKIKDDKSVLIRESISYLSKIVGTATIGIIDGNVYYAGLSEMVNIPEFREAETLKKMLAILEDYSQLSKLLNSGIPDEDLHIIIGEEAASMDFKEYSIVFSEIRINGNPEGYIAVLGPNRMHYDVVLSAVKHIGETIRMLLKKSSNYSA